MIYGNRFLSLSFINESMAGKLKLPYTYTDIDYIKLGQDILKSIPNIQKIKQIFDNLKKKDEVQLKEEKKKLYPDLLLDTTKNKIFKDYFKSVSTCAEFGSLFEKVLLSSEFALKYKYGNKIIFNTKEEGKDYFIKRYHTENDIEKFSDKMMNLFEDIADKYEQISDYLYDIEMDKNSSDSIISIAREASKKAKSISDTIRDYYIRHGDEWYGDTVNIFDNFTKSNKTINFPYTFEETDYKRFIDDLRKAMPTEQKVDKLKNLINDALDNKIAILRNIVFDINKVKTFKDYLSRRNATDEYEFIRHCEDMVTESFINENYTKKVVFKNQGEGRKYFISTFKNENNINNIVSQIKSDLYDISENYKSLVEYINDFEQENEELTELFEMIAEAFDNIAFMLEKLADSIDYRYKMNLIDNFNLFING